MMMTMMIKVALLLWASLSCCAQAQDMNATVDDGMNGTTSAAGDEFIPTMAPTPTMSPSGVSLAPSISLSPTVSMMPSSAPSYNPTASPNACKALDVGDIQIILLNSDDPDQIVFFAMALISRRVDYIYVTDDAWDGERFVGLEGTVRYKVPEATVDANGNPCGGMCPGHVFSYGFPADNYTELWETALNPNVPFELSTQGDTLLTYCLDGDGNPHFLNGFSWAPDGWAVPGLNNYTVYQQSSLPAELELQGSIELPFEQNWIYIGTTPATKEELVTQYYNNPEYYVGDNEIRNTYPGLDQLPGQEATSAAAGAINENAILSVLLLWITCSYWFNIL